MASAIRFQREPFSDALFAELLPLLSAHKDEIAHYADIPLDVDTAAYHVAEANGALRMYTARSDAAGESGISARPNILVGYAVFFVRRNPHYAGSVQAVQDVLYVSPERRGMTGAKLIRFADAELLAEGVQAVYQHVKLAHDFGSLLTRLGYEPVETIYAKRLDRNSQADGGV